MGVHNIAIRLVAKGHNPTVIIPHHCYSKLRGIRAKLGYRIINFPPKLFAITHRLPKIGLGFMRLYLAFLQRKNHFDVWHCTVGYPIGVSLVKYVYESRKRIPHLVRCTGDDIQKHSASRYGMRNNPFIDEIVKQWLPRSERVIAITGSVVSEYERIGIKQNQIESIPNGVDTKRFAKDVDINEIRERYNIPNDHFMFLCVGRHHPKKGFDYLVDAVSEVIKRTERAFIVVFTGKNMDPLKKLVLARNLTDYILFIDQFTFSVSPDMVYEIPSDDLIDLYKSADAFVFPSLIETFGIVLIEAMAAGLPIVTTNAQGCSDLVKDMYNGLVCSPMDSSGLAAKMAKIMSDESLRNALVKNGLNYVNEFDWDVVVDKYIELYQSLIGARHPGSSS